MTRLKPGAILEVTASNGFIYLQFLGKHAEYGDAVRVCPSVRPTRCEIDPELFADSYVTFYPANLAVKESLARVVGHLPPIPIPTRFRRPGAISNQGTIESWIIEDNGRDEWKKTLSEEESYLPLAGIWNHECLLYQVSTGWRPEKEGRRGDQAPTVQQVLSPLNQHVQDGEQILSPDEQVLKALADVSDLRNAHAVKHYLYFPSKANAKKVAEKLRAHGFRVDEQSGDDDTDWLVLARHNIVPTKENITTARSLMEQLAQDNQGDYDGWEAAVQRK